jgi:16S rRNA (cytosine967-C5)-methyltransferase
VPQTKSRPIPIHNERNNPSPCPRSVALAILNRLNANRQTLDRILEDAAPRIAGLARRDRALFNQLVYGVLRWRLHLDAVIEAFADRPLKKIDPPILNILRIGLFQIRFLDRIPQSAAVNTSVDLARRQSSAKPAGFVNALLRNVLRRPGRFVLPDATASPVDHLAIAKSFPPWLISRWIQRLGVAETARLCDAMNAIPPITLRCNTLRNNLSQLADALANQVQRIEIRKDIPGALDLAGPYGPLFEMPAFVDGCFAVQDGAAQLVSLLLSPRPGERVLDACAGLGGKTTHLAQLMNNRGTIVAMDHAPAKLARLERETHRLGVSIVRTRRTDLNRPPAADALPRFDRILLDAPCSGLGVLRRNPDAKWSAQEKDIARCAARQMRFLDHLAPLLKKDGVLVYAVCSLEPEENEQVIAHFLKKHPNFAINGGQLSMEKSGLALTAPDGFLRTVPPVDRMDGFFAARLIRRC